MQLSKRLLAIANEVPEKGAVADVGCDHAYTSIYLATHKDLEHIIAMDVRTGPLEKAKENIRANKLENIIETRLSDGLQVLSKGKVDTVVISGMGGALIQKILTEGSHVLEAVKCLVLQPQTEKAELRHYLHSIGMHIKKEVMLIDEGKYYNIIVAVPQEDSQETPYQKEEYEFGRLLLEEKDPILKEFLEIEGQKVEKILLNLEAHREKNEERIAELEEKHRLINKGLDYFKGKE